MSNQVTKKSTAQNNESFLAGVTAGILPIVPSASELLTKASSQIKTSSARKNKVLETAEKDVDADDFVFVDSEALDISLEDIALVDGEVNSGAELTLTQSRGNESASSLIGSDGWNILGGVLLLGGVIALGSGGGGVSGAANSCTPLVVTDDLEELDGDLNNIGNITVTAEEDDAIIDGNGNTIYLCNNENNLIVQSISADVDAVFVSVDIVGNLDDVNLLATELSSEVYVSMLLDGNVDGEINILATGEDSYISSDISISGDMNGALTITASGESSDVDAGTYVWGEMNGDITITTADNSIDGDFQTVYAELVVGENVTGDLLISAEGDTSSIDFGGLTGLADSSSDLSEYTFDGDITVTATGDSSEITGGNAFMPFPFGGPGYNGGLIVAGEINASDSGITLSATGDNSLIEFGVVAQSINADITVLAEGDYSEVAGEDQVSGDLYEGYSSVIAFGGGINGDTVITASGDSSDIDFQLAAIDFSGDEDSDLGNIYGSITVEASGICSDIEVGVFASGNVSGDMSFTASGFDSSIDLSVEVSGDLDGDMTITASSDDADIDVSVDIGGDVNGDITITAAGEGDVDIDLHSFSIDGDVNGDISFLVTHDDADIDHSGGDVDDIFYIGGKLSGDLTLTSSSDDSDIDVNVRIQDGMTGNVTVSGTVDDSDTDLDLYVTGSLIGDVTLDASGSDEFEASDLTLELNITENLEGKVTLTASGDSADIEAWISIDGDFLGSNSQDSIALEVTASGDGVSTDINVSLDVLGGMSGDVSLTASGSDSYIYADISVDDELAGDVVANATGVDSDIYVDADVLDNMSGDVTLTASNIGAYISADIYVDGDLTGDVVAYATGDNSDIYVSVDVTGDMSGDITVSATGLDSHISADIVVDGDVDGDVTIRANAFDADDLSIYGGASVDFELTADSVGQINIETGSQLGVSEVEAYFSISNSKSIQVSSVGDTYVVGNYDEDVTVGFNDLISSKIYLDSEQGTFNGSFNLEIYGDIEANNDVNTASVWTNAFNPANPAQNPMYNRFIEIIGFTGEALEDGENGLDTIYFSDYAEWIDVTGDTQGDDIYTEYSDLYSYSSSDFSELGLFLTEAERKLESDGDTINFDGDFQIDFFLGFVGNDMYLAVDNDDDNIDYLVKFVDFANEADSLSGLALTDYYEDLAVYFFDNQLGNTYNLIP